MIHQYFLRDGEGGGARFNEMVRRWTRAGHEVTVLAGQVHYATGFKPARERGRLFAWYAQEGARVLRVFTPGSFRRSLLHRALAFGAFGSSATLALASRRVDPDSVDVVVASSPSLMVALPALWTKHLWRKPLVFEVRDLWPESAITTGVITPDGPTARVLTALERAAYAAADHINAVTPAIAADILRRGLCAEAAMHVIPNGADIALFDAPPRQRTDAVRAQHGWGDRHVALYLGAHGIANHLQQLIEAAERLRHRPDVVIAAVGDGPMREALLAETHRRGLTDRICWSPPVPREDVPALLAAADIGLAVLRRVDTFKTVYPNKVFDIMAARRPVICAIDGAARALIEEAQAGVFVEPEDADALASAITTLADDPARRRALGESGGAFVRARFDRDALAQQYLDLLTTLHHAHISTKTETRTRASRSDT